MTDTTKTEALRLAEILERPGYGWHSTPAECAAELRRLSSVEAERDRLAAECEALRADAAMLRFLEQKAHWDDERDMAPGGRWWVAVLVRDGRPTFRAAITAAMGGKE